MRKEFHLEAGDDDGSHACVARRLVSSAAVRWCQVSGPHAQAPSLHLNSALVPSFWRVVLVGTVVLRLQCLSVCTFHLVMPARIFLF